MSYLRRALSVLYGLFLIGVMAIAPASRWWIVALGQLMVLFWLLTELLFDELRSRQDGAP
jgi:uncharacterized YccA/Bax inhibitor family protein